MSAVTHAAVFFVILFITSRMPDPASSFRATPIGSESIIWMPRPGAGGGGGGGGNRSPAPPRRAEAPGTGRVTVRPQPPIAARHAEPATPPPEPTVQIDALPTSAGITEMPGTIAAMPSSTSLGPGSDGGAGSGRGGGDGPSVGVGAGPGRDRGTGGGPYEAGANGVTFPRLIREVPPNYTNGALRARVQGIVYLRAVVNADGSVGDVWITRSLDPVFGIDDEAVHTVKQWRFAPATHNGKPVTVVVPIELRFTLR